MYIAKDKALVKSLTSFSKNHNIYFKFKLILKDSSKNPLSIGITKKETGRDGFWFETGN